MATHLEALDDALIIAAGRFGDVLGGGRRPDRLTSQPSAASNAVSAVFSLFGFGFVDRSWRSTVSIRPSIAVHAALSFGFR